MISCPKVLFLLLPIGVFLIYQLLPILRIDTTYWNIAGQAFKANKEEKHLSVTLNQQKYDDKCGTIFREISLSEATRWEVATCKIKPYHTSDLRTCLQRANSKIAIVGDSRSRQIYEALVRIFEDQAIERYKKGGRQLNMTYRNASANFHFYWLPFLNGTAFPLVSRWVQKRASRPDILIIGLGSWYIYVSKLFQIGDKEWLKHISQYQVAMRKMSQLLDKLAENIPVIWLSQVSCCTASSEKFMKYNEATEAILNGTHVTFWKSAFQVASLLYHTSPDGAHYSEDVLEILLGMILNFYCNSKMNISDDHCCSSVELHRT